MAYVVKSLLVVAKTDGGYVHVYEGGELPEGTDEEQVKQLLDSGMIEEGDGSATKSKRSSAKSSDE